MILATDANWWTYTQGTITTIVALTAAFIALLAWWTNREKLRLDLFARRYAVYEKLRVVTQKVESSDDTNALKQLCLDLELLKFEAELLYNRDLAYDFNDIVDAAERIHELELVRPELIHGNYARQRELLILSLGSSESYIVDKLPQFLDFQGAYLKADPPWHRVSRAVGDYWKRCADIVNKAKEF